MANIRSFKELRVWQNAIDVAMKIFELTKSFPAEERFSLTDQIQGIQPLLIIISQSLESPCHRVLFNHFPSYKKVGDK